MSFKVDLKGGWRVISVGFILLKQILVINIKCMLLSISVSIDLWKEMFDILI